MNERVFWPGDTRPQNLKNNKSVATAMRLLRKVHCLGLNLPQTKATASAIILMSIFWSPALYAQGVEAGNVPQSEVVGSEHIIQLYRGQRDLAGEFRQKAYNAVLDHPDVVAALADQRGAVAGIKSARAGKRPSINVSVSGDLRVLDSFENVFDNLTERSRPDERVNASLIGRKNIFDAGATKNRVGAAEALAEAARKTYAAIVGETAQRAASTWIDVMRYRVMKRLADDNVKQHENFLSSVEARLEQGIGVRREVARANARLMDARARRMSFLRGLEFAEANFEEVFGYRPDALVYPGIWHGLPRAKEMAIEWAMASNYELAVRRAEAEAARMSWQAAKSGLLPSVNAELAATKFDLDKSRSDYSVTGRLVVDYGLYSGGARSAEQRRAFEEYRSRESQALSAERRAKLVIDQAWSNWQSLKDQAKVFGDAVDANTESRAAFLEQFRASRGSLLDLLQAENDYFEASVNYSRSLAETDLAAIILLKEAGQLQKMLEIEAVPQRLDVR